MRTVIKVEDLGKQYRLGEVGTGTLSNDLDRWWARMRGKEDPFAKIGEINDRTSKGISEYIWALKDINFEVKEGEVLGIIGRNGAGKSTLLKILSKVTKPTSGRILTKGRIASLLEVGTGFHPEMTGRDNIFLNGAIMGMNRAEIRRKLDEIIDFSGVERYIDTPVKRYSSGMYVRLAFAVAAHLEPEILIIDEVLAVGDAEFQKKCLGKMKDVSTEGRTVLFVSHNMTAVTTLCDNCIYLKNGRIISEGQTGNIVTEYLTSENGNRTSISWNAGSNPGDNVAILHSARLINTNFEQLNFANIDQKIGIEYIYEIINDGHLPIPNVHVVTAMGEYAFVSAENKNSKLSKVGIHKAILWIPGNLLNDGTYIIGVALSSPDPVRVHFYEPEALMFEVIEDIGNRKHDFNQRINGVVRPALNWDTVQIS